MQNSTDVGSVAQCLAHKPSIDVQLETLAALAVCRDRHLQTQMMRMEDTFNPVMS